MTGVAVGLVLCSAALHATWNIVLKASDDPLRTAARTIPLATLAVTPAVVVAWLATGRPLLAPAALAIAAGSGLLELAYFRFLSAAFRAGDLSTVYPIARGTAPALAAAAGLVLLRERLDTLQIAGAGAVIGGIWLVRPARGTRAAVPPAVLTGVCIAAYSTLDGISALALAVLLDRAVVRLRYVRCAFAGDRRSVPGISVFLPGISASSCLQMGSARSTNSRSSHYSYNDL